MSKIIEKYFVEDEIEFFDLIKLNEKNFTCINLHKILKSQLLISSNQSLFRRREYEQKE
jgi:hypothetical protein